MKRLLAAISLALISIVASATTLNPVQLLNPVGSTSGQAIVSTGSTTAPDWASIVNSVIAGSGITVSGASGNVTVSLTSPVTVALGGTGAATLAAHGVLIGEGTGAITVASPGTSGLLLTSNGASADPTFQAFSSSAIGGVTNGSNAAAGIVGEYVTNSVSAAAITSAVTSNVLSISLTAGDWDVSGVVRSAPAGGTSVQQQVGGISTTSATLGPLGTFANDTYQPAAGTGEAHPTPTVRVNVSTTTTVFLVATIVYSGGSLTADGFIRARRVR